MQLLYVGWNLVPFHHLAQEKIGRMIRIIVIVYIHVGTVAKVVEVGAGTKVYVANPELGILASAV